jgi:response regulator RpfG family c-di-GMP phosphodiesterase
VVSVLIAENDRQVRGLIAGWLEDAGYACVTADTSNALAETRIQPPAVVLVAVYRPDDPGMWVLRRLASERVPVATIALIQAEDLNLVESARRVGAFDCLPWPSSSATVIASIQRAIDWKSATADSHGRLPRLLEEVGAARGRLVESIRGLAPSDAQTVLLAALEGCAPALHHHAHRVAELAVALGTSCRLTPGEVHALQTAALLRDIGRLALPSALLESKTPPGDDDLAIWQMHVAVAETVLSAVPAFAPAATIVATSYERFDGTGFPVGLAGTRIPAAARVLAVAAAYDRLVSPWGFDEPMTHEDANTELVRRAGTQLDPDIVRAWLEVGDRARCC